MGRAKRRPGYWAAAGVGLLLLWLFLRVHVTAEPTGKVEKWREEVEGKLDGTDETEVLYSSEEAGKEKPASSVGLPFALDKDPTRYVPPTKEDLQKYVGENPKWFVKDNGAGFG